MASKRKTTLVVSPTHKEGARVTKEIREELKRNGKLGQDERKFVRLVNLQWTEAQRIYLPSYRAGLVVQFHRNAPGFVCGQRLTLVESGPDRTLCLQDQHGLHRFPVEVRRGKAQESSGRRLSHPATIAPAGSRRGRRVGNSMT